MAKTDNKKIVKKNIHDTVHEYLLIDTPKKCKNLLTILKRQKSFCFDTETTGLDLHESELVGISFSFEAHKAYYISIPDDYNDALKVVNEFKEVFKNSKIEKKDKT